MGGLMVLVYNVKVVNALLSLALASSHFSKDDFGKVHCPTIAGS